MKMRLRLGERKYWWNFTMEGWSIVRRIPISRQSILSSSEAGAWAVLVGPTLAADPRMSMDSSAQTRLLRAVWCAMLASRWSMETERLPLGYLRPDGEAWVPPVAPARVEFRGVLLLAGCWPPWLGLRLEGELMPPSPSWPDGEGTTLEELRGSDITEGDAERKFETERRSPPSRWL